MAAAAESKKHDGATVLIESVIKEAEQEANRIIASITI